MQGSVSAMAVVHTKLSRNNTVGHQYSVLKYEWSQTTPPEAPSTHQAVNKRGWIFGSHTQLFLSASNLGWLQPPMPLEGREFVFLMDGE